MPEGLQRDITQNIRPGTKAGEREKGIYQKYTTLIEDIYRA